MSYVLFAYVGSALLPALKKATTSALQALARRRRWAKAREQINELDDHALRDLGVSRSEFKSYFVESERLEQPAHVRTRIAAPTQRAPRAAATKLPPHPDCGRARVPPSEPRHPSGSHRKLFRGAHVAARP